MPCTTVNKRLYCVWAAGLKLELCKIYFLKMGWHVLNTPVKKMDICLCVLKLKLFIPAS